MFEQDKNGPNKNTICLKGRKVQRCNRGVDLKYIKGCFRGTLGVSYNQQNHEPNSKVLELISNAPFKNSTTWKICNMSVISTSTAEQDFNFCFENWNT